MVDQVPRVPPSVGDRLIKELELAFGTPPQPGKERKPVIDALVEIARFVRSMGCSQNVVWGLTDLAYALQDLDAGQVAPVLKRTKPNGAPPDSSLTWMKRVRILAVQYALHRSGTAMEAAAKDIGARRRDLKSLMTRGKDLPSTIMRWRRELDEAKQGTFLAQFSNQLCNLEEMMRQEMSRRGPGGWRQLADNILASVRP